MIILDTSVGQKELHTMFSNGYDINDLDGWWILELDAHLAMVVIMQSYAKSQKSNQSQTLDSVVWNMCRILDSPTTANL